MLKAFKTEIKVTPEQKEKINKTLGTCRYVYNLYLAKNKEQYEKDGSFLSGYDFSKWLNNVHTKKTDFWIKETSSKATKQAILNGNKAFLRFFKKQSGFPRFKKKKDQDIKAYLPKNNPTDWMIDRHRIKIPTFGWVRLKEFGYIPKNALVKSGTISQKADRYYVSVLCEIPEHSFQEKECTEGIGLDLGIKDFAICSNGQVFENINKTKRIKNLEKRLKREQRSLSRKFENKKRIGGDSATFKGTNIYKNTLRVQKLQIKLTNIRKEYRKQVVMSLTKTKPKFITIEHLNIKGMMKNRHLSKTIGQQGFYDFKIQLINQCSKDAIELREVSPWYPSSKLCAHCGEKKNTLSLSERIFICSCGHTMDRDLNASINLKNAKEFIVLT